uniref:Uncharacterized protein n=1 Tax=Romanomermis culicivorax TaxID=13658 RepID=A0A915L930_ROMCU
MIWHNRRRAKVEEMPKFVKNRKSEKLPESPGKMEENRSCHSTAMGYKKGFYKKLVNPEDREFKKFDYFKDLPDAQQT